MRNLDYFLKIIELYPSFEKKIINHFFIKEKIYIRNTKIANNVNYINSLESFRKFLIKTEFPDELTRDVFLFYIYMDFKIIHKIITVPQWSVQYLLFGEIIFEKILNNQVKTNQLGSWEKKNFFGNYFYYLDFSKKKFDYYCDDFRKLRLKVFLRDCEICAKCGIAPKDGISLTIDHIKPVSKYPNLALDENNLQVLCWKCNQKKSNKNCIDYRKGYK